MALTSSTYPTGVLPALNTDADALAVTQFLDIETVDLTSDIANGIRDQTVQVDICFAPVGTPGQGVLLAFGFEGYLTSTNGTYVLTKQPGQINEFFHLFDVVINKSSNTAMTVDVSIFFGIDTGGFLNDESSYNPAAHLAYTEIEEFAPFFITNPSVYGLERELLIEVKLSNDQSFVFRKKLRARHFNKEISGAAVTTISGPLFELPQELPDAGDIPITLTFNTLLITVDTADYICGVFRASNPILGNNFVEVLDFNMVSHASGSIDSRVPGDAITATNAITALGGGLFSVEIEIDRDFPVDGVSYYVFFLIRDTVNDTYYPLVSPASEVDTVYPPTAGNISVKLASYDMEEKVWETDCFAGVTPNERVNVSVTMDKISYNSNIIANQLAGNFNTNFKGALFASTQVLPATVDELLSISRSFSAQNFVDNGNSLTVFGSGRIPAAWAGQTGFFLITFVFDINLGAGGRYTDYISIPIRLIINQFDDHPAGFHRLSLLGVVDENGDPVNPALCLDAAQRLIFSFELTGVVDPADYVFIPYLKLDGTDAIQEFNTWNNQYLRRLEEKFFITADQDFSNAGVATVEIDPQLLKINSRYCVGAIAKGNTSVVDPPDTLDCPTFDLELIHSSDNGNNFGFEYGTGINLTNFSIPVTIEALDVIIAADFGQLTVIGSYNTKGFASVQYSDYISSIPVPNNVTFRYYINIVTVDSSKRYCEYHIEVDLLLSIQLGTFFENSTTLVGVTPD